MKHKIIYSLLAVALLASSFKIAYDASNKTADVNKVDGVFVFTDAQPVKEYTKLGEVKVTIAGSSQYTYIRNKLITKAKNEFTDAEAVILYFHSGQADRAEVIKFK